MKYWKDPQACDNGRRGRRNETFAKCDDYSIRSREDVKVPNNWDMKMRGTP
jgi:hypothetical protein